jgi:hypothetical protein
MSFSFSTSSLPNDKNTIYIVRNSITSFPHSVVTLTANTNLIFTTLRSNYSTYYKRVIVTPDVKKHIIINEQVESGTNYIVFNGQYAQVDSDMSREEIYESAWNLIHENFFN